MPEAGCRQGAGAPARLQVRQHRERLHGGAPRQAHPGDRLQPCCRHNSSSSSAHRSSSTPRHSCPSITTRRGPETQRMCVLTSHSALRLTQNLKPPLAFPAANMADGGHGPSPGAGPAAAGAMSPKHTAASALLAMAGAADMPTECDETSTASQPRLGGFGRPGQRLRNIPLYACMRGWWVQRSGRGLSRQAAPRTGEDHTDPPQIHNQQQQQQPLLGCIGGPGGSGMLRGLRGSISTARATLCSSRAE